jgi:hypothetical protein
MKTTLAIIFLVFVFNAYSEEQPPIPSPSATIQDSTQVPSVSDKNQKQGKTSNDNGNLAKFEEESNVEHQKQMEKLKTSADSSKKEILFDISTTHGKVLIENKTSDPTQVKDVYQLKVPADQSATPGSGGQNQPYGSGYGAQR